MSSAPAADEIWKDAHWLVQALDPNAGLVRLVEMDADAYRSASFLDDRLLQARPNAQLVPWAPIAAASPGGARDDVRWIFHIGHVGSTLVARLLGELDGVLALREPRCVYDLTFFPRDVRDAFVPTLRQLLSRTFSPRETAVVKATSFAAEIAAELIGAGRAMFLYMGARRFIQAMLAGDNSRQSLATLRDQRAQRMRDRVRALDDMATSDAHLAAAAWACEMTALEASAEQLSEEQVHWADFDRMLVDMQAAMLRAADFFGFEATADEVRELVSGPLMTSYSKAPEYRYGRELREELLAQAERDNRPDIDDALVMLDRAAKNAPLLQRALERSTLES